MLQGNSGGHLVQSSAQNRVSCDEVKLGQTQVFMQFVLLQNTGYTIYFSASTIIIITVYACYIRG